MELFDHLTKCKQMTDVQQFKFVDMLNWNLWSGGTW